MGYLDNAGLAHFWGKVKSALAGKQNTIAAGAGISKTGDTLSVTTPVQGVVTQAEFDALPEAQRSKGLYVISDGGSGGVTMEQVNDATQAAFESYIPPDIYAAEETRIGTWIDGKPLYRRVVQGISSAVSSSDGKTSKAFDIPGMSNISALVKMDGMISIGAVNIAPINFNNGVDYVYTYFSNSYTCSIWMSVKTSTFAKKPMTVILEYTKTTD